MAAQQAWEGLNFMLQLQSPISLFPVNDIIAYIKPLKHVSFICLISNSEHTSWKLCLIVKLKTFGFPSLAEICRECTSSLVGFSRSHFYTAIGASQKTNQIKLQNQITSVQAGNTSYISLPLHSGQDTISPKSCWSIQSQDTPLCMQEKGFPEHAWKKCSCFHEKMEWNLLQALLAAMLLSPPHVPPAAAAVPQKGGVGRRRAHQGGSEPPQAGRETLKSEPAGLIKLQAARNVVSGGGFSKSSVPLSGLSPQGDGCSQVVVWS